MNKFLILVLILFPFVSKAEVLDNISFTINKKLYDGKIYLHR